MKTMFSAFALVLAAPVAAQPAPAADPHAAHKQGGQHKDHGGKADMDCAQMPCCAKRKQHGEAGKKPDDKAASPHHAH